MKLNAASDSGKGEFHFPKRDRFNEEAQSEIKSEFHIGKLRGSMHFNKKALQKDNLSALADPENATQATRQTSRFSKSLALKSKIATSKKSGSTIKTARVKKLLLSKDDSSSPSKRDGSPMKSKTLTKIVGEGRSSTGAITTLGKSFVRKLDCGN